MKIILGDNQFFGVNHFDLQKGSLTKKKFGHKEEINDFIKDALKLGLDGFMINSNQLGYEVVQDYEVTGNEEIHYSIPYPHKYASLVNEKGMIYLLKYFLSNTPIHRLLISFPKFIFTRNIKYLVPLSVDLEVPDNLPKGSVIYFQNVLTDILIGINGFALLESFVKSVRSKGYRPGIITLNPLILDNIIKDSVVLNQEDLIVCFNINHVGFNVFPNRKVVEEFISRDHKYDLMGMSIFSSGGSNIQKAIEYVKGLSLDYVVFGTSKLNNVEMNYNNLKDVPLN